MIDKIKNMLFSGSERTVLIKKNIMASSMLRVVSTTILLIVVLATIYYINAERNVFLLTISPITPLVV